MRTFFLCVHDSRLIKSVDLKFQAKFEYKSTIIKPSSPVSGLIFLSYTNEFGMSIKKI